MFKILQPEPPRGLEPRTYGLQNRCSTIELGWQSEFILIILTALSFIFF